MDYSSSWVDTSLDLYSKPLQGRNDPIVNEMLGLGVVKEVQSKSSLLGRKLPEKEEAGALVEELNRVSEENKKLTEMLSAMYRSYNALREHMMDYVNKVSADKEINSGDQSRKRKSSSNNNYNSESSSTDEESSKKPREEVIKAKSSRVYVKTDASGSLVVNDGYQWRKYGQKVTRDNPYPRAYFKCSFAPSCPVKKKVQRSAKDHSLLEATYEGEHNHPQSSQTEATSAGVSRSPTFGSTPFSTFLGSSQPTITLDLTKTQSNKPGNQIDPKSSQPDSLEMRQLLVERMASSLTKDPKFTAALAAAISGKMFQ